MTPVVPAPITVYGRVAYDGTDYHGFQYQVGVPTIQADLEAALDRFSSRVGRVAGAGRTDAGVHACGQVISVTVRWAHGLGDLQRAWNAHLPQSIAVRGVQPAPDGFHPRFSAVSRTYRYTVQHHPCPDRWKEPDRSPLTDRYALFETRPLDLTQMRAAAELLVGTFDFATFGRPPQGESTVRTVERAEWRVAEEGMPHRGLGRRLEFTITANAFLRQMVRCLVGSLIAVGRGEWSVTEFQTALAACDRARSAPPAPPQGLELEYVTYPDHLDTAVNR